MSIEQQLQETNKILLSILNTLQNIDQKLAEGLFDPNAPVNSYGEGLLDGIQNSIVRGQDGIST